jgi:hypothetical protein
MSRAPAEDLVALPTTFAVGGHSLLLAQARVTWRWTATMDGRLLEGTFQSQAEAWEEGVREADRVDKASDGNGSSNPNPLE